MFKYGKPLFILSVSESSNDLILKDLNENYNMKNTELQEIGSNRIEEKIYEIKIE